MSAYDYAFPRPRVKRRPGSRKALIELALLDEIEERRAQGACRVPGRTLFYRLTSRRVIEKQRLGPDGKPTGRQPDQDVADVLTELREAGVIGMEEVLDRTRGVIDHRGWTSIAEAARAHTVSAPLDPWNDAPPFLFVESESLAALLDPLAAEFRVPVVPLRGQGGTSLLGGELPRYLWDGARILYIGDLDLSGGQIETSARRRAQAYAGVELEWERLALTDEQAVANRLEPIVKKDRRYRPARWHEAIETEALDERVLLRVVRGRLEALLPQPLAGIIAEEERQRHVVLAAIGTAA